MNKLITRLGAGALLIVCLSSCTVFKAPVSVSYVDINTGVKAGGNVDIKVEHPNDPKATAERLNRIKGALGDDDVASVAPAASAPAGPKIEVCSRFVPPPYPPLPKLTEAQMAEMAKLPVDRFNEALLVQMKAMYRYSKAVQALHDTAFKKHLATCRQAVVQ